MKARIIYGMGASGCGKDSLMGYARAKLAGHPNIAFDHRCITCPANAGGENHVSLSPDEFASRAAVGLFALHWQSHGQRYGIDIEINQRLASGATVIVNGSREYLLQVSGRYQDVVPLLIEVSPEVLRERLLDRGRETRDQVEKRMQRHQALAGVCGECLKVDNDGPLHEGGDTLIGLILYYSVNNRLQTSRCLPA
jgi:ribose 1,5-bisphosphokinase